MTGNYSSMQLVDGDGVFNATGLDHFVKITKMAECETSYAVVSIMGPQSSGKSTLLNHLFGTNFTMMDASKGRPQTTKGIWLARCAHIQPFTVVMDIEGTDGRERGEDDTTFEKQSALFALAVSDILLINMWCNEIGREQAANKPLLRTVFEVMIRLFALRKITLIFVVRDKTTKTPPEQLEDILRKDIQKIWDNAPKTQAHKQTRFSDFFNVEVVFLSHYEYAQSEFKKDVASLRKSFHHYISTDGLDGDRRGVVPASAFALSTQQIWKTIKENKDLDLPAVRVMVATVRCEAIANEKFSKIAEDINWGQLERVSQINEILDECLSGYDEEAIYFDEAVRTSKRKQLLTKLLQIVRPAYFSIVARIPSETLSEFKKAFDAALATRKEGFADVALRCKQSFLSEFDKRVKDAAVKHVEWNSSEKRDQLARDIDDHIASVRASKLHEYAIPHKSYLDQAITEPVRTLLSNADGYTWAAIRELFGRETGTCIHEFSSALHSEFHLDRATTDKMTQELLDYAKETVKSQVAFAATNVLFRMKKRFKKMFDHDDNNMPRTWKSKTAKEARSRSVTAECVKMLAATAAVRLEHQPDNIENILLGAMTGDALSLHMNILDSNTWDQVAPVNTLISPVQCKDILSQFKEETELIMMARKYDSIQVIDGDGGFNATGLDHFMKTTKMAECGESYVVVSIMGPQSGGKSTLLNNLFITNFMEMNASKGRSQTTKGIWLAKCAGIEPFTVVMDLEGTDGSEREDDTTFEKQSALFALAVSDILLINMWCHDIGREQAANKPLLKAVFQAMMRLFTQRKTTLLFVIRDKSKTPLRKLEDALKKDIRKIWNNVPKPQAHRETHFSVFFNVEVVALTNYETKQEIFMEQVAILRRRFHHSTSPGRLAGDRRGVVPASGFALSTQQIWKTIKENKDLDLPKHKVMVATVRCEEIANEIHSSMTTDMEWCEIKRAVEHQMVPGFGKKLSAILDKFLSRYDTETNYFDEGVKTSKRKQLVSKLIQTVFPALQSMERHILSKTLDDFKAAFDEALVIRKERFADATLEYTQTFLGEFDKWVREDAAIKHAHWDLSKVRDKLRCDIDSHVDSVRVTKLNELTNNHKVHLNALAEPVGAFLHEANACTWQEIGGHFRKMILTCKYYLSSELSEFDLDQPTMNEKIEELEEHAKRVVISEAASVASNALVLMKDRFETIFLLDEHHQRRDWKRMRDIRRIAPVALSESRKLLAVLAAVRLDDRTDNIENLLSHALANDAVYRVYLNSNTWDQVTFTIITPIECTSLLSQLENKTKYILLEAEQAVKEWKKHKRLKIIRRIISTGSAILAVHSNPFLFPLIIPALLS